MDIEKLKSQMRKGLLEMCVMATLEKKESYPSEIMEALGSTDLIVVEGTIYPLLTRLKNDGLLTYRWEESNSGPPRKYYSLTQSGVEFLKELKEAWSQLGDAINKTIK